jgi:hypothetical protein
MGESGQTWSGKVTIPTFIKIWRDALLCVKGEHLTSKVVSLRGDRNCFYVNPDWIQRPASKILLGAKVICDGLETARTNQLKR